MAPKPSAKQSTKPSTDPEPPTAQTTGTGKFWFPNNATYEGDWLVVQRVDKRDPTKPAGLSEAAARVRHGIGTYTEGNYTYTGQWEEDNMHGQGKFIFASGAEYDGAWAAGKYNGLGVYKWRDGRAYKGEWKDGRMHGPGVFTDCSGHRWSGQFFNGGGPGLTCLDESLVVVD